MKLGVVEETNKMKKWEHRTKLTRQDLTPEERLLDYDSSAFNEYFGGLDLAIRRYNKDNMRKMIHIDIPTIIFMTVLTENFYSFISSDEGYKI